MGQVRRSLIQAGFALQGPERLATTAEEAEAAVAALAGEPIDLLILLQATFADSTMALPMAEKIEAPLLLWALPEEADRGAAAAEFFLRGQSRGPRAAAGKPPL